MRRHSHRNRTRNLFSATILVKAANAYSYSATFSAFQVSPNGRKEWIASLRGETLAPPHLTERSRRFVLSSDRLTSTASVSGLVRSRSIFVSLVLGPLGPSARKCRPSINHVVFLFPHTHFDTAWSHCVCLLVCLCALVRGCFLSMAIDVVVCVC